ncbi:hypothetical protein NicSoilC12_06540 [Arthrobacter sp. NicSoilC12]|nr:hypothetical protein NicSoilC12_06540 [Arthrobacter sp. NicSoilC12]
MDFQDLGDQPQGPHDAVEFPVVDLDRTKATTSYPTASRSISRPPSCSTGAQHAPHARLGGVPRDAQGVTELADLDPRIPDQLQQDIQVGGVQTVQIITPVHLNSQRMTVLLNFDTNFGHADHWYCILYIPNFQPGRAVPPQQGKPGLHFARARP